jgi:hypothetical protein
MSAARGPITGLNVTELSQPAGKLPLGNGGRVMRNALLAGAVMLALASAPARAADMPVKAPPQPSYDWNGDRFMAAIGGIADIKRI